MRNTESTAAAVNSSMGRVDEFDSWRVMPVNSTMPMATASEVTLSTRIELDM